MDTAVVSGQSEGIIVESRETEWNGSATRVSGNAGARS
ncbi:hypothetical protein F4560_004473 [Saccharothrix ecbatanensis]|uniref:Uncharacterized protein n=1 Tax=Saccharothrix ecbatanensis TaxID=1105145 RepID=A0A7W9HM12_9PSEU|nr:hypothetical protein [Saccharothrix ecbatanensis]